MVKIRRGGEEQVGARAFRVREQHLVVHPGPGLVFQQ